MKFLIIENERQRVFWNFPAGGLSPGPVLRACTLMLNDLPTRTWCSDNMHAVFDMRDDLILLAASKLASEHSLRRFAQAVWRMAVFLVGNLSKIELLLRVRYKALFRRVVSSVSYLQDTSQAFLVDSCEELDGTIEGSAMSKEIGELMRPASQAINNIECAIYGLLIVGTRIAWIHATPQLKQRTKYRLTSQDIMSCIFLTHAEFSQAAQAQTLGADDELSLPVADYKNHEQVVQTIQEEQAARTAQLATSPHEPREDNGQETPAESTTLQAAATSSLDTTVVADELPIEPTSSSLSASAPPASPTAAPASPRVSPSSSPTREAVVSISDASPAADPSPITPQTAIVDDTPSPSSSSSSSSSSASSSLTTSSSSQALDLSCSSAESPIFHRIFVSVDGQLEPLHLYATELSPNISFVVLAKDRQQPSGKAEVKSELETAHASTLSQLRSGMRRDLRAYFDFWSVQWMNSPKITADKYVHQLPGLIHFIFADRSNDRIMAPVIKPLEGNKYAQSQHDSRLKELIKDQVWSLCSVAQEHLVKGYTSLIVRRGRFLYSYRLWIVDAKGAAVPMSRVNVPRLSNAKEYGVELYKTLLTRLQEELKIPSETPLRCYELYTLYLSTVPIKSVVAYDTKLSRTFS